MEELRVENGVKENYKKKLVTDKWKWVYREGRPRLLWEDWSGRGMGNKRKI